MTIFQTSDSCIYALINEQDKRIFITYSRNFNSHLYSQMLKLSRNEHEISLLNLDRAKLDIKILETGTIADLYMKFRVYEIQEEWIAKGYTVYKLYKPLHWILTIKVEEDFITGRAYAYRASVFVKTSINRMYRLKSFDKLKEAQAYVNNNAMVNILKESNGSCG